MDAQLLEQVSKMLNPTAVMVLIAALLYIIKEVTAFVSKTFLKAKDKTEENTLAVLQLNNNISNLMIRLSSVEESIKKFTEVERAVWKMEKDINFAHEKIRDIQNEQ